MSWIDDCCLSRGLHVTGAAACCRALDRCLLFDFSVKRELKSYMSPARRLGRSRCELREGGRSERNGVVNTVIGAVGSRVHIQLGQEGGHRGSSASDVR
jgi:hypothetical protein